MINPEKLHAAVCQLGMMKYFPSDPGTRDAIALFLGRICHDEQTLEWLVKASIVLFTEWPGPSELLALYTQFGPAADGSKAYSAIYIERFPMENPIFLEHPKWKDRQIAAPQDSPREIEIQDPELKVLVETLSVSLPKLPKVRSSPREIDSFKRRLRASQGGYTEGHQTAELDIQVEKDKWNSEKS